MRPHVSSEVTVKELLDRYPQLLQLFMDLKLLCPGCPAEAFHTLADVAREYHLDLNQLCHRIEKSIGEEDTPREMRTHISDG